MDEVPQTRYRIRVNLPEAGGIGFTSSDIFIEENARGIYDGLKKKYDVTLFRIAEGMATKILPLD